MRLTEENSLVTWCNTSGEIGELIKYEWTGIRNDAKIIDISKVTKGSNMRMMWKCKYGHTWFLEICNRVRFETHCPECSKRKLNNKNSLYNWCMNNEKFGLQLLSEWTGITDSGDKLDIKSLTVSCGEKVLWRCSNGHEWFCRPADRTYNRSNCPLCSYMNNRKSLEDWCNEHKEIGDIIKSEWTGADINNNNNKVNIKDITFGSSRVMLWKCKYGHIWETSIVNRTHNKSKCPKCAANKVSDIHSKIQDGHDLMSWCTKNGWYGSVVLKEWTGLDQNNIKINIENIGYASRKKMIWRCSKGHTWVASINNRVLKNTGCPLCVNRQTSYAEQFIYFSIKEVFNKAESRVRVNIGNTGDRMELDIGIPFNEYEQNKYNAKALAIEYSPTYTHLYLSDRSDRDNFKRDICNKYGVWLITIIDDPYNEYNEIFSKEYIIQNISKSNKLKKLKEIIYYILDLLDKSEYIKRLDFSKISENAYKASHGSIDINKSLGAVYPELIDEWDTDNISIYDVTPGSAFRASWKCYSCGHKWNAEIHYRTSGKSGCPNCHANIFKKGN